MSSGRPAGLRVWNAAGHHAADRLSRRTRPVLLGRAGLDRAATGQHPATVRRICEADRVVADRRPAERWPAGLLRLLHPPPARDPKLLTAHHRRPRGDHPGARARSASGTAPSRRRRSSPRWPWRSAWCSATSPTSPVTAARDGFTAPLALQVARLSGPLLLVITALGIVTALFRTQLDRLIVRFSRALVVVIGLSEEAIPLLKRLAEDLPRGSTLGRADRELRQPAHQAEPHSGRPSRGLQSGQGQRDPGPGAPAEPVQSGGAVRGVDRRSGQPRLGEAVPRDRRREPYRQPRSAAADHCSDRRSLAGGVLAADQRLPHAGRRPSRVSALGARRAEHLRGHRDHAGRAHAVRAARPARRRRPVGAGAGHLCRARPARA